MKQESFFQKFNSLFLFTLEKIFESVNKKKSTFDRIMETHCLPSWGWWDSVKIKYPNSSNVGSDDFDKLFVEFKNKCYALLLDKIKEQLLML